MRRAALEAVERTDAVRVDHKIKLQGIVFADHAIEAGYGIVGPEDRRSQRPREYFELGDVRQCLLKQEIDVDSCDRGATQGCGGVAYEDRLHLVQPQRSRDLS